MVTSWHSQKLEDVLGELKVNPDLGLSKEEVKTRQARFGRNLLPKGKKLEWWQLFLRQFLSPLVIILLIAAGLTFFLKELVDFYVISLAILVNVFIGFWQEFRSNQIFEKLEKLVQVQAKVKRVGRLEEIDMAGLVPGDIILLKGDTKIPADARLIETHRLLVDEALLTGESKAIEKKIVELKSNTILAERVNMVYMGTIVERGEGLAVVTETASGTEIGKIAALTAKVQDEKTPLQNRLAKLGKTISIFVLLFTFVIFVVGRLEYRSLLEFFKISVAVAVAAIPEGLPAALSVVLAVSASRILSRRGLVKKLVGAETLGSTSVIVTDKTGTLTEGRMKLHALSAENPKQAALSMALSSDVAQVLNSDGQTIISGEATDKAKVEYFIEINNSLDRALKDYPRVAFLSFNPQKKYLASFHKLKNGTHHVFVSGAPEILLTLCKLSQNKKNAILAEVEKLARQGFRVIGIAERSLADTKIESDSDESLDKLVNELNFLGTASFRDPIREDVKEAIQVTRQAHVRVIMATGDHHLTAQAIGEELGFKITENSIVSGEELEKMTDGELEKQLEEIEIFSRVNPEHKMRVLQVLKKKGEVVAMTGDGVNDAPALRASDIGIALGSGTDIAKETSDLILLDNSFSIITAAIREGRIAFDNMRKVTVFLLSNSFTEIIIILGSLFLKTSFLPVTAVQILWANLVEDSFPNFALAFEPGEEGIMQRKPYRRGESILDKQGLAIIFIVGILSDLMLVGIFYYLYHYSFLPSEYVQTIIFALLAINSLFIVFAIKSYHKSVFQTQIFNNRYLVFAVLLGFTLMGAAIYAPPLQKLLGTVSLSLSQVGLIIGITLIQFTLIELVKWGFRKTEVLRFAKEKNA